MRLVSFTLVSALSLAALPLAACADAPDAPEGDAPAVDSAESPVIGGHAENGFPAVGYLEFGNGANGPLGGSVCGATLIGPDVVVTAAP